MLLGFVVKVCCAIVKAIHDSRETPPAVVSNLEELMNALCQLGAETKKQPQDINIVVPIIAEPLVQTTPTDDLLLGLPTPPSLSPPEFKPQQDDSKNSTTYKALHVTSTALDLASDFAATGISYAGQLLASGITMLRFSLYHLTVKGRRACYE